MEQLWTLQLLLSHAGKTNQGNLRTMVFNWKFLLLAPLVVLVILPTVVPRMHAGVRITDATDDTHELTGPLEIAATLFGGMS